MRYVRLGKSDLEVSRLGLDCQSLGIAQRERGWDPFSYDGRFFAIRTVHAALDAGINVFDTSPLIGRGRAETLLGKALRGRKEAVVLTSRVEQHTDEEELEHSVLASIRRLRSDRIDILYMSDEWGVTGTLENLLREQRLEVLDSLRSKGIVRHIGLLVSDPERSLPLIDSGLFDVVQLQCSVTQDGAAFALLERCKTLDIGVSIVKPVQADSLHSIVNALDPDWEGADSMRELCLKYLLSDQRVQLINVGMRWEHEVMTNSRLVAGFDPVLLQPQTRHWQLAQ